jgi:hypothetical protein
MIKKKKQSILLPSTMKCLIATRKFRATILTINSIPYIWQSLPTLMGKTIPNRLMISKCTFTGFTLLFGNACLGVTIPAEGEVPAIDHEQDLHCNLQATRVITGILVCSRVEQGLEHPNCKGDLGHTQGSTCGDRSCETRKD